MASSTPHFFLAELRAGISVRPSKCAVSLSIAFAGPLDGFPAMTAPRMSPLFLFLGGAHAGPLIL